MIDLLERVSTLQFIENHREGQCMEMERDAHGARIRAVRGVYNSVQASGTLGHPRTGQK